MITPETEAHEYDEEYAIFKKKSLSFLLNTNSTHLDLLLYSEIGIMMNIQY